MKKLNWMTYLLASLSAFSTPVIAHESDDPLLTFVHVDQLEWRDNHTLALEAEGWIGYDLNKLWLKTDLKRHHGNTEEAEWQALYSRAVSPYWDMQMGLRQDVKPQTKSWATLGLKGLAPYFFDVDAAVFVGEQGHTAARLSMEYEWLFTQKWILSPEISLNAYGQNDHRNHTGSGLSDLHAGLRLRYEIRREFAPYIGINWQTHFGNTVDMLREEGESTQDTQWVAGIKMWF